LQLQRQGSEWGRGQALRNCAAGDHDFYPLPIARLGTTAATSVAQV
jgi:hypothetical protein